MVVYAGQSAHQQHISVTAAELSVPTCDFLGGKLSLITHEVAMGGIVQNQGVPVGEGECRESVRACRRQLAPLDRRQHDLEPLFTRPGRSGDSVALHIRGAGVFRFLRGEGKGTYGLWSTSLVMIC